MKLVKEIFFGFVISLGIWILLYILYVNLLGPRDLGRYADPLYVIANILVLAWFISKRRWVAVVSLTVFAIAFAGPVLLFIVSVVGCAIGQCPVF